MFHCTVHHHVFTLFQIIAVILEILFCRICNHFMVSLKESHSYFILPHQLMVWADCLYTYIL